MKYNIQKRYRNFHKHLQFYIPALLTSTSSSLTRDFINKSAVINFLWNEWNVLWRTIWLANIIGGIDKNGDKIVPLHPNISEQQATFFLKNNRLGGNLEYHNEKTWGGLKEIQDVALNLYNLNPVLNPTLPISQFGLQVITASYLIPHSLDDFRVVRNAAVHLSEHKIKEVLKVISARYVVRKYKYPTDALNFESIASNKKAIVEWKEELAIFLEYI